MPNERVRRRQKLKIKIKTKNGREEYVLGDGQPIDDQESPDPDPTEIERRLGDIGNLEFVGAIFHSHSSPG